MYEFKGVLGIIKADLTAKMVLHTQYKTQLCSIAIITAIEDMDEAFLVHLIVTLEKALLLIHQNTLSPLLNNMVLILRMFRLMIV